MTTLPTRDPSPPLHSTRQLPARQPTDTRASHPRRATVAPRPGGWSSAEEVDAVSRPPARPRLWPDRSNVADGTLGGGTGGRVGQEPPRRPPPPAGANGRAPWFFATARPCPTRPAVPFP